MLAAAFLCALLTSAQATQAQPNAYPTKQETYDAAQAAFDKADWAAASAGFSQLLPSEPPAALSATQAIIGARYAEALGHLQRLDEAEAWIDSALRALPKDGRENLGDAWLTKGDVEKRRFDYPAAMNAYAQAETFAGAGITKLLIDASVGEAVTGATVDPALVKGKLDALRASPAFAAVVKGQLLAQIEDLTARAAINLGDKASALDLARKAVGDSGGLSTRLSTVQAGIRMDAGTIARLSGENNDANRYLTFAGAGHLPETSWLSARSGELPVCDDDIHPEDTAVVALAIGDDGQVVGAIPTYASKTGRLGETFAKALSAWRWDPEAIKTVPPFWRSTLQFGLRCVTRPKPERLGEFVWQAVSSWLFEHKVLDSRDPMSVNDGIPRRVRPSDPRLSRPGGVVLEVATDSKPWSTSEVDRLWRRLEAAEAPPEAFAILISGAARQRITDAYTNKGRWRAVADDMARMTPRFRSEFPTNRALLWLMLEEALARQEGGDFAGAQLVLAKMLQGFGNPSSGDDPLQSVALLHQAIGFDRTGDAAAARATLERSKLDGDKCSLLDTSPLAENRSIGPDTFPGAALAWSFEGFAEAAFDIADDGHVKNVRTVIAYPPYIFSESTEQAMRRWRYIPPRLGGKAVGCESQVQTLKFKLR
jgi:hypothetical protein